VTRLTSRQTATAALKDLVHFETVKILEGPALRAACEKHGVIYEEVVEIIGDFPTPGKDTMMA